MQTGFQDPVDIVQPLILFHTEKHLFTAVSRGWQILEGAARFQRLQGKCAFELTTAHMAAHAALRYFRTKAASKEPMSHKPPARHKNAKQNWMIFQRMAGRRNSRTPIPISNTPMMMANAMHIFMKHFINSSIPSHLCKCPICWHHAILIFNISAAV